MSLTSKSLASLGTPEEGAAFVMGKIKGMPTHLTSTEIANAIMEKRAADRTGESTGSLSGRARAALKNKTEAGGYALYGAQFVSAIDSVRKDELMSADVKATMDSLGFKMPENMFEQA